jgi:hypothetical protein
MKPGFNPQAQQEVIEKDPLEEKKLHIDLIKFFLTEANTYAFLTIIVLIAAVSIISGVLLVRDPGDKVPLELWRDLLGPVSAYLGYVFGKRTSGRTKPRP